MTAAIVLLVFLFVLGIGISTILYVSKNSSNFSWLASWGLLIYLLFSITVLACMVDVLPTG